MDCTRGVVHYYVGLEVTRLIDRRYRVTMRILDAQDRSWVTGSGKMWEGRLTAAQRRAFEQSMTDEYFRGTREIPFSAAQADVLAARLAHDLTCNLLRQVAGEYVIGAEPEPPDTMPLSGALELVRNNLAGNPVLQITANADAANARLEGKAHPIAGDLHQYWVTITPTGEGATLAVVSTSVYVRLPNAAGQQVAQAESSVTHLPMRVGTSARGLIEPLRIVEPRQRRACYSTGSRRPEQRLVTADHTIERGECFLIQSRADRDASVFLLNYQVSHGLVRLSGRRCGSYSPWAVVRAGQALRFPTANDSRPSASAWQGQPGLESFYALAVADTNAARELGVLVDQLPTRCTLSTADGLKGPELQAWLGGLKDVVDRWQHALDWQAVRVEHVY